MTRRTGTEISKILVIDHDRSIPSVRSREDRINPEVRAELRIAGALAAGVSSDVDGVSQLGFETALDAMALNTKLALASDLDCFVDWCLAQNLSAFPAEAETIVRYLDARSRKKAKVTTLARRVASISTGHAILGLVPEGPQSRMVKDKLKALRRLQGARARQAEGIRFGAALSDDTSPITLKALLDFCDEALTGVRDAALLSTGYDAGLRVSELCAIEVEHLRLQGDGSGELFIPLSKTDQESKGSYAWLSADTMRRIGKWLEAADIKSGPIFRRVHVTRYKRVDAVVQNEAGHFASDRRREMGRSGGRLAHTSVTVYTPGAAALTRHGVNSIYKRVIQQAWAAGAIDVPRHDIAGYLKKVSTHSLRVGLTQDLIANGQDGIAISQALRWTSPSTALRYGARLKVQSGATAKALGPIRS